MNVDFKIRDVNSGHCQITYSTKNDDRQTIFYGLQDNGAKYGGVRLMRCTNDGEPMYEIKKFKDEIKPVFELPKINEYDSDYTIELKELCIEFIKLKGWS